MWESLITLLDTRVEIILAICYSLIAISWFYALSRVWRFKHIAGANQAMSGAIAMILSMAVLIFRIPLPYTTLVVFLAAAQFIIVLSYTKLLGAAMGQGVSNVTLRQAGRPEQFLAAFVPKSTRGSPGSGVVRRCYVTVMFFLGMIGILAALILPMFK